MLFNSFEYIVFLIIVISLFYLFGPKGRRILILVSSFFFYCVWSIPFSLLLVGSIFIDYFAAQIIERNKEKKIKKIGLFLSLFFNLGVLCIFKYADFFSNSVYSLFGFHPWPIMNLILPLGISFYTFQTMSYTIDVYRGDIKAKKNIMDVAIYVSFFPQLVAGPIIRADVLLPYLNFTHVKIDREKIQEGISLIIWGLLKKVFFADVMGNYANEVFNNPERFSWFYLIMGVYAFAVQIYCDFSGYSDIAIGSAKLLNIDLPKNFDNPYLSTSLTTFWRKWHMSLSSWLRDYLYIPLGGNRKGKIRTYINLMITMLLGGLWHGAGWNWVVWGGIQGFFLSLEKLLGVKSKPKNSMQWIIGWIITFHVTCFSWIFFRAHSFSDAIDYISLIFSGNVGDVPIGISPIYYLVILLILEKINFKNQWLKLKNIRPVPFIVTTIAFIYFFVLAFSEVSSPEFIYFQF